MFLRREAEAAEKKLTQSYELPFADFSVSGQSRTKLPPSGELSLGYWLLRRASALIPDSISTFPLNLCVPASRCEMFLDVYSGSYLICFSLSAASNPRPFLLTTNPGYVLHAVWPRPGSNGSTTISLCFSFPFFPSKKVLRFWSASVAVPSRTNRVIYTPTLLPFPAHFATNVDSGLIQGFASALIVGAH